MIRTNSRKKNIIKKCLVLFVAVVVLVGAVVFGQWQTNKEHQAYEESLNEGTEVVESGNETEVVFSGNESVDENAVVSITNLDYYCTPVMGEDSVLLVQSLNHYLVQKGIICDSGEIISVQVPQDEPESVRYYVQLNDERNRIVILEYHTVENLVTCSLCNYSYEEIVGEIWNGDAPTDRDVCPEDDLIYSQEQTAGEVAVEGQEVIQ